MILMSSLTTVMFFGGWWVVSIFEFIPTITSMAFALKLSTVLFFYIWVRASFPRYRIDQLMRLCWKIFLPLALGFVILIISLIYITNGIY